MSNKLQVTIFKKSKRAPYPDHIVVARKSPASDQWHPYDDTVHLYFNKGVLAKFVHVQDAPKGKRVWDPQTEKYVALEPKHQIANEFVMKDRKTTYKRNPTSSHFYTFGYMAPDTTDITFCNDQTHPGFFDYFKVRMDLKGKWRNPDDLDKHYNNIAAEIKEVYSNKGGKECPRWQNLKKNEHN